MAAKGESKSKADAGLMPMLVAVVLSAGLGLGAGFGGIVMFAPAPVSEPPSASADVPGTDEHSASKDGGDHGSVPKGAEEGQETAEDAEAIDKEDLAYAPLPPVITNLVEPANVWLRLEGGITYLKSGEKKPDILAVETAQQIVQFLKTVRLADIQGNDGMLFLRDDLNEVARSLSGGQVQNVLVSGLIVE